MRLIPVIRLRAAVILAAGALVATAAGCSSSGDDATFTPAAAGARAKPTIVPNELPPIGKFIRQSDGSSVTTVSSDYLFDVGSDKLVPEASQALAELVPTLREHAGKIQIVGYTDGLGATDANLELSRRRGEAVKAVLVEDGIDGSVLQVVPKGEEGAQDGAPDSTRRKVEIVLK
ncbi:OmpA family protein [Pseudofrankia asymbiotica]|uniref:OmpA family protein n=1 Tax=Pseudofrankia asymbiotica TaxID=1834516 RepID=UPI0009783021|nr:OmpA family protein [Pseudofrankia asymbiotica]